MKQLQILKKITASAALLLFSAALLPHSFAAAVTKTGTATVKAWNATSDKASMMADCLSSSAVIEEEEDGTLYATILFQQATIMSVTVTGQSILSMTVNGTKILHKEEDTDAGTRTFRVPVTTLEGFNGNTVGFSVLMSNDANATPSNQTARLNFSDATLTEVEDTTPSKPSGGSGGGGSSGGTSSTDDGGSDADTPENIDGGNFTSAPKQTFGQKVSAFLHLPQVWSFVKKYLFFGWIWDKK